MTTIIYPADTQSYNNAALTIINGQATDSPAGVGAVKISIQEEATGKYFNGNNFVTASAPFWISTQLDTTTTPNNWQHTLSLAALQTAVTHGNYYIIQSSGTDAIGNIDTVDGRSRWLYDNVPPVSAVTSPIDGSQPVDPTDIRGTIDDTNGDPSTPYSGIAQVWVQILRDPNNDGSNPNAPDGGDFYWNGSTWVASATFVPVTAFDQNLGTWIYNWPDITKWVHGQSYYARSKTVDFAGNNQATPLPTGNHFQVTAAADHLAVVVSTGPWTAGTALTITVQAQDSVNAQALGYAGTIHFLSSDAGEPETNGSDVNNNGLPADYTFTTGSGADNGLHVFSNALKFRMAGTRSIRATDTNTGSITGVQGGIVINPGTASQLFVFMEGEVYAPGKITSPVGRSNTGPTDVGVAGSLYNGTVYATDQYYNLVASSQPIIQITASDTFAVLPATFTLATGAQPFAVTFKTAGNETVSADYFPAAEPFTSSVISVTAGAGQKLLILAPGETAQPGSALGKTNAADRRSGGNDLHGHRGSDR